MVRPALRRLLDVVFRSVSLDGVALLRGSPSDREAVARRAGDEVAHLLLGCMEPDLGSGGVMRDVAERFAALTSSVVEAAGPSLSSAERDAYAGAALCGLLCAIDGSGGYGKYLRRFGSVTRYLEYSLLGTAEETVADRDAMAASLGDGSFSQVLGEGVRPVQGRWYLPLPSDRIQQDVLGSSPVVSPPGEPSDAGDRDAPCIRLCGSDVETVWSSRDERLYHGPMAIGALGYASPTVTLTQLQKQGPDFVRVLMRRGPGGSGQRRKVRFLTATGLLLAMIRVKPSMETHGAVTWMVSSVLARSTGSPVIDVHDLDRRLDHATITFLRANAISKRRVERLETLVRDYEAEARAAAAEIEDARMGEVARRRHLEVDLASLSDDVAELTVKVEILEAEKRTLVTQVSDLRILRDQLIREKHGLDTKRSIGPRGGGGPGSGH